ncbi:hypothetical protein [Borreliella lusitaniae]|uniref:Lipoprotein n=1 Tax=Borreliella lusitaniae TaxID=100177 RepID=A0ABZ0CIV2_9SPIR|nr:hypothetical protein [Borreliella lusitaniae]WNY69137.1 hypothetical protein QIA44_04730 [Borreliella lusitaniae]
MRKRFFSIHLFLVLIFLFSCNGDINQAVKELTKPKKELTKEERAQALKTVKSKFKDDPKKMARVDEYFEKKIKDPAERDALLQVIALGTEYENKVEDILKKAQAEGKNLNSYSPEILALKTQLTDDLKNHNYTEKLFTKLGGEFINFVNGK